MKNVCLSKCLILGNNPVLLCRRDVIDKKTEVRNASQRRQRRTEPQNVAKIGRVFAAI